jgi:hypothetical protein
MVYGDFNPASVGADRDSPEKAADALFPDGGEGM